MKLISASYSGGSKRIIQFFIISEGNDHYYCLESNQFSEEAVQAVRTSIGKLKDEEIVEMLRMNYPQQFKAAFKKLLKDRIMVFGVWELKKNPS